ncbi:MAG: hypothetical protein LBB62_09925 [Proteiniphilum sp.]|jgi:hypothetical protein|nr:hypothetical protein [Proteiniphilum sp.]
MLRKEGKKYCAESCSLTGNRPCVGTLPQAYGLLAARPVRDGIMVEKGEHTINPTCAGGTEYG